MKAGVGFQGTPGERSLPPRLATLVGSIACRGGIGGPLNVCNHIARQTASYRQVTQGPIGPVTHRRLVCHSRDLPPSLLRPCERRGGVWAIMREGTRCLSSRRPNRALDTDVRNLARLACLLPV